MSNSSKRSSAVKKEKKVRATNQVATECRNAIWTRDKLLCGLTEIQTHLGAADRGSQMGRAGFE